MPFHGKKTQFLFIQKYKTFALDKILYLAYLTIVIDTLNMARIIPKIKKARWEPSGLFITIKKGTMKTKKQFPKNKIILQIQMTTLIHFKSW